MVMFAAAYLTVWLAVVLYIARMSVIQGRIERTLETIQSELESMGDSENVPSKAA